ncbi:MULTISPECIES: enoyl-CoA hydratase/isomerase family protein [Bacillaceae]|uniref:Enoyl-CoA hydratase/isomerase family protein n=1 Tax=Evansella alkalicola TaxID=745819 RepID=A0ABS6JQB3_9BACI|nr:MULTISPECIES: enoyl-CoA hydratase/isomerase family protein [Bacillaceae]MBU9720457.1 enoyl-CoA hydratase/isomerase family protein [Bacillus alkalicola]
MEQKVIGRYRSSNVAEIILNRPQKRNAVDYDVIQLMSNYLDEFSKDKNITVLLIRGEGEGFCSGGDLQAFHQLKTAKEAMTMLEPMCKVLKKIVAFPAITVAYLNGTAVGGGAELAASTDFCLSKETSKVGFIQGKLQITTGWGGTNLLCRRVGAQKAMKMLATGKVYGAQEAFKLDFVHDIVPKLTEVDKWNEDWLSPDVVRMYKKNLYLKEDLEKLFLSMDQEVEACASLWEKEEHHLAVQQFLQRK